MPRCLVIEVVEQRIVETGNESMRLLKSSAAARKRVKAREATRQQLVEQEAKPF